MKFEGWLFYWQNEDGDWCASFSAEEDEARRFRAYCAQESPVTDLRHMKAVSE